MLRRAILAAIPLCLQAADLWNGLPPAPHATGFRFERTVDPLRPINARDHGTPLGLAIWYPARSTSGQPLTQFDYRLLSRAPSPDLLDDQARMMVSWRHVGIVPLTLDQARAALRSPGRAYRGAPPLAGRFPLVVLLGGPFYLSTTAEFLAGNGFVVVAPVRFEDVADEAPSIDFPSSVENAVRDAEWAMHVLASDQAADTTRVTALGHGGGGLQAMMLAMRNRAVQALVNVDSGNFSQRTNPRQLPFYSPRILRVPYLNVLTAATRQASDLYADFEAMRFSRRCEVVLNSEELRHHDLSDIGRGVAALGMRPDTVLQTYAGVQSTILGFLRAPQTWSDSGATVRGAVQPAPDIVDVIGGLGVDTPRILAEARVRDREAPLFTEDNLLRIIGAAMRQPNLAAALARFALQVHPNSLQVHAAAAGAMLAAGDREASAVIGRCLSLDVPPNDWRAAAASAACRERGAPGRPPR